MSQSDRHARRLGALRTARAVSPLAREVAIQAALALCWYASLVLLMRLAGKRLAGQTTTFDLVVLISLGVVLQQTVLREGAGNALVFVVAVFAAHRGLAAWCARSWRVRRLVRGVPRALVRDGRVCHDALEDESLSLDELCAGLRKLGYEGPEAVRLATLEETGHVSAIPIDAPPSGAVRDRGDTPGG